MGTGPDVPFVRHTFLSVKPEPLAGEEVRPRSRSQPVENTCDLYAREVHALMFKPRPVHGSTPARRWGPRAASPTPCDEEADADAVGTATPSMPSDSEPSGGCRSGGRGGGGRGRSLGASANGYVGGASEDFSASSVEGGTSDAEEEMMQLRPQEREPESQEPLESILARVPRDQDGQPLSLGSVRHALGDCRPCAYFANRHRPCENGVRCSFCHFQHAPKRRLRLCRRKRLEMREIVASVVASAGERGVPPPPKYVPISWSTRSAREAGALDAKGTP